MAKTSYTLEKKMSIALLLFLFDTHLLFCMVGGTVSKKEVEVMVMRPAGDCVGKVGDCLWEEGMEMEMDYSEINRRVLLGSSSTTTTQKRFISYEALKGNVVPCSRPGAPYYNCHALSKANPYTRGCSAITGCARDIHP